MSVRPSCVTINSGNMPDLIAMLLGVVNLWHKEQLIRWQSISPMGSGNFFFWGGMVLHNITYRENMAFAVQK